MPPCPWPGNDPLYQAYHDTEWGVPVQCSRAMFAHLVLESFQSGLSWITILRKRPAFGEVFADFNPEMMARFTETDIQRLLADARIVRNRRKIEAAITNAQAFLALEETHPHGFAHWLWQFNEGNVVNNRWRSMAEVPPQTPLSMRIHKELKGHGFVHLGPTTVYAHMQATGMVNDHLLGCPRHTHLGGTP